MEDPFVGLLSEIDARAAGAGRSPFCVGTVLEAAPGRLVIRADGLELDQDDLMVAGYLAAGWTEQLTGLGWALTADIPQTKLTGSCKVTVGSATYTGTAEVARPASQIPGRTAAAAAVTHPAALAEADRVLLLRSGDGQTYYVLCKFVRW